MNKEAPTVRPQDAKLCDVCVTGYSALLPGACGADAVWQVLAEGRCMISQIPEERWSSHRFLSPEAVLPGHTYTRGAGVLADPFGFDAGYFGVTPREAEQMDPQQRLLLEATARAFDHAGIDPARLAADRVGVFVGAASADHSTAPLQDTRMAGAQFMLGNTASIISNRLSHQFDLRGPSMTVDTACSSALVALDQARRAIGTGVIDMAVVGGVNLLLSPFPFIGFAQAGMLSPTGLVRAFGAGADGYVRAEGAVVFILERLDAALPSGRRVRSVLAASAVNTAGRTPGIALPSAERQAELMVAAMEAGKIDPDALAFIEAHGTGTAAGDPIEAQAIGQSYGHRRRAPLPIGSSKSNFGHLEPAAGLVGLLKAQLALEHGHVPATLHCAEPNPDIDFTGLNLDLLTEGRDLPSTGTPAFAAVNSFGFGGANAHVVLRQHIPSASTKGKRRSAKNPPALMISAASESSLRSLAEGWRDLARAAPADLPDRIATANWRRALHRHRLCIAADGAEALATGLEGWLSDARSAVPGLTAESLLDAAPTAFVFSGNGALWAGAGRHLFETDPVFRATFCDLADGFTAHGLPDIRDLLDDPQLGHKAGAAEIAQPLTFAIQVALADSLAEAGLRPQAVAGHSLGEVAAAVMAGRITRAEGTRIVAQRCRAFAPLHGTGTMAALACARDRAQALIAESGLPVEVSAENAPESVTVSGPDAAIEDLLRRARSARIAGRALPIAYPYHSSAVEPLRDGLISDLADLAPRRGTLGFYSGCQGAACDTPLDASYWWQNARAAVAFRSAVMAMAEDGVRVFVEISPRTVLRNYLRDTLADFPQQTAVVESLDSTRPEQRTAATIARAALAAGGMVDRSRVLGPTRPVVGGLPDYPFDRRPYHLQSAAALDLFARQAQHPFLGGRMQPDAEIWQGEILLSRTPWLADHRVADRVLLPAMAMLEIFAAAGADLTGGTALDLRDVEFLAPVEIPEADPVALRVVHEAAARRLRLEIGGTGRWQPMAVARLFTGAAPVPEGVTPPDATADVDTLYTRLASSGLDYGPAFARLRGLGREGADILARLDPEPPEPGFLFDPRSADAALHGAALLLEAEETGLRVPARIDRAVLFAGGQIGAARLRPAGGGGESVALDALLCDTVGQPVIALEGLRLRPLPAGSEPPHAWWDETLVPLAGGGVPDLDAMAAALIRDAEAQPSDGDVLRAALGGRLAWDRLTAGGEADPRDAIAAQWLTAAGHVQDDGAGKATLQGDCPWPEMDTLIAMLPQVTPQATAELKSALEAAEGVPSPAAGTLPDLARTLAAALSAGTAPLGRIALIGAVDRALVAAAMRRAAHVTVLGEDADALARLRARLGGQDALRFCTLDAPEARGDADLVLLAGVTQTVSEARLARLADCVAPGGALLGLEEAADIFALMTGRQTDAGAAESLAAALRRDGLDVDLAGAANSEALRLIRGTRMPAEGNAPQMTVTGTGEMADALRALTGADGAETPACHAVCARIGDDPCDGATLFTDLPEGSGPLWLVVDGIAHWATLTGWRRTLANETGRDLRLICHDAKAAPGRIAALIAASPEHEILLREDAARSPRILPVVPAVAGAGPRRLETARRGGAGDGLHWQSVPEADLSADAVEIDVAAAGLNFRDVMWAQGLLPPEALEDGFAGACLGMECAGRVRRAGPASGFKPGDAVLAMASHAMAGRVVTPAAAVMPLPDGIDPVTAAGVPVVFLTADFALTEVARLAPGETVLIHGAAGGVGQAALQVARRAGARVIATAGNPAKRRFARAMGAEHVFDSRSLAFDAEVMQATGGRGVDVVLNALAGEALERSLACLAPFGRFVELGKRDLYENSAVALRAMRRNVSLHVVDVDQLMTHRPEAAARCMARLAGALDKGEYTPLPTAVFPSEDAGEAMRAMQRAAHIGKIVLRAPEDGAASARPATRPIRGGWLVTGGTSGFGLEAARWLADQGAEHLWLVSRSGQVAPEIPAGLGAPATALAADVTDAAAMAAALETAQAGGVPLRGVVHGAAVFDDGLFTDQDTDRMSAVLAPKLGGARLLDRLTREIALDHFWMFSSVAARFGNPAQAAYVAANRGLEGIAEDRAAAGLPALAIAWGPVGDAGYLARSEALRAALAKRMPPMTARAAFTRLAELLQAGHAAPTVTIAPVAWGRLAGTVPVLRGPLFDLLQIDPDRAQAEGFDLGALLREKGPKEARKILTKLLVEEAAQLMRAAPGDIDPRQPLQLMGFDSLMAMNLRLAVEERLNVTVPVMSIDDSLTLAALINRIIETETEGAGPVAEGGVVGEMAQRHLAGTEVSEGRAATFEEMVDSVAEEK